MPFGMKNTAATFQRVLDLLLGDLRFVLVHIDIVVRSMTWEEHLQHLEVVFPK